MYTLPSLDRVAPLRRAAGSMRTAARGAVAVDQGGHEVHRRGADEAGDEQVDRLVVEFPRTGNLLQHALFQHRHPVAESHGLGLVVGDVYGRDAETALQPQDLGAHLAAQLRVEVGQRFVEQERVGLADDGPAHRHPLALAAGELRRLAVEVLLSSRVSADSLTSLRISSSECLPCNRSGKAMFSNTRQVRVERVILEHHRQVAVARRLVVDPLCRR